MLSEAYLDRETTIPAVTDDYQSVSHDTTFVFKSVTNEQALSTTSMAKATEADDIPTKANKLAAGYIAPSVTG